MFKIGFDGVFVADDFLEAVQTISKFFRSFWYFLGIVVVLMCNLSSLSHYNYAWSATKTAEREFILDKTETVDF